MSKDKKVFVADLPNLYKDWHPTKNGLLTPFNRVKGNRCPLCSNKIIVAGTNDLATTNPELIEEWIYEKNYPITPYDVSSGSHTSIWWKCKVCGHEWKTAICNRKYNNCPQCAITKRAESNIRTRVILGENDLMNQYPQIAIEWHPSKNGNIFPHEIVVGSNKIVWWKCNKGHEWRSSVVSRTKHGNTCPYCNDKKVLEGFNDVFTLYPKLCEEWNYEKNIEISPNKITKKCTKKYGGNVTYVVMNGKALYVQDLVALVVIHVQKNNV